MIKYLKVAILLASVISIFIVSWFLGKEVADFMFYLVPSAWILALVFPLNFALGWNVGKYYWRYLGAPMFEDIHYSFVIDREQK